MKNKKLITIISVTLLLVVAVAGTLAWLTDRESVLNTFTVGNVNITLDEAVVDEDGNPLDADKQPVDKVENAARTDVGNNYHLIPGETYVKDPTVTVVKGSEESYVRMLVKVNCVDELDAIFAAHNIALTDVFKEFDAAAWNYIGTDVVTEGTGEDAVTKRVYEFRYNGTVTPTATEDVKLDALFDTITVPGVITGEEMQTLADLKIEVEGHAIQIATFEDDADAAWAAFDAQIAE